MAAASGTTWHPRTQFDPKSWLLTNGEVVTEPPLEETQSGRKVRVVGSTVSMFSKQVDEVIFQGVQAIASSKQANVWMALGENERRNAEASHYGQRIKPGLKANLHLLKGAGTSGATTAWWRFRHPSLPIEALLVVEVSTPSHYYGRNNNQQEVSTALLMPSTNSVDAQNVTYIRCVENALDEFAVRSRDASHRLRWTEFYRDNKPNWFDDFRLRQDVIKGERPAVKALLDDVQAIDGYDKIDVPDLRDPSKPAWMTLELHDTNVNGDFIQTLKDYLDGSNVVAEVKKHWDEMVGLLRSAGLILEEKDEASFASALAGGDPVTVEVKSPPAEQGHTSDVNHSIVLHLPSGTMLVNCSHTSKASPDQIAEKWEEALTLAQLTGQEDALLAYARKYQEQASAERTKRVLAERNITT